MGHFKLNCSCSGCRDNGMASDALALQFAIPFKGELIVEVALRLQRIISNSHDWSSKSVAAGLRRRRSDRYPESAEPRCCDRLWVARLTDLGADPIRVHWGELQQRQSPRWRQH